jgi:hypothetical protein
MTISVSDNLKEISGSIFESKSAYVMWKTIAYSRSTGVVSEQLAKKYVAAQCTASGFFAMTEKTSLVTFVIFVLHCFDKDEKAHSFYKVDKSETERFVSENSEVLESLKLVRDKAFAHKDIRKNTDSFKILVPSIEKLDIFFENLFSFYNSLTSKHLNSSTMFDMSTNDLLNEMEYLFMNITRGEVLRKLEIDMEWMWEKDDRRISNIFHVNQE